VRVYSTDELPFAAFLYTTRRLRFLGCKPIDGGGVAFTFDDPHGEGQRLLTDFEAGAECPSILLYETLKQPRIDARSKDIERSNFRP